MKKHGYSRSTIALSAGEIGSGGGPAISQHRPLAEYPLIGGLSALVSPIVAQNFRPLDPLGVPPSSRPARSLEPRLLDLLNEAFRGHAGSDQRIDAEDLKRALRIRSEFLAQQSRWAIGEFACGDSLKIARHSWRSSPCSGRSTSCCS